MTSPTLVVDNVLPMPAKRAPRAPSTLGEIGKREWQRIAPALAASGRLTDETRSLVVSYCEAVEGREECAAILKKQGRVVNRRGQPPKAHPAVRQHLQYQTMALRLAEKLGIVAGAPSHDRKAPRDAPTGIFD